MRASEREKEEIRMPAKKEALFLSPMLKSFTMGQAYGRMEVRAIGSATRHIAIDCCQSRVLPESRADPAHVKKDENS